MAESLKILGQVSPGAGVDTTLYAPGAGVRAVVSTLVACNTTGAAIPIRVHARPGGVAAGTGNAVAYDHTVPANDSVPLTWGMALAPGDILSVRATAVGVAFTAFGVEVT